MERIIIHTRRARPAKGGQKEKGENHMSIIYNSRYTAEQHKRGNERIVRVGGGYIIMSARQYQIWKRQKKRFVRDIMRGLDERRLDRKEAEAQSVINNVYADYATNKHYPRGKKATAWQYQT